MEEQIIEAVRPHLVLYDTNHSDYMKSKLKQDIWSAIAKDLNLSNALCHVVFPVLRLFALRPPTFQYYYYLLCFHQIHTRLQALWL